MAEFCLDCWNKLNKSNDGARELILSDDLDLCEGCGQWRRVVIAKRDFLLWYDLRQMLKRMGGR